jgi:DNA-binding protein Fis
MHNKQITNSLRQLVVSQHKQLYEKISGMDFQSKDAKWYNKIETAMLEYVENDNRQGIVKYLELMLGENFTTLRKNTYGIHIISRVNHISKYISITIHEHRQTVTLETSSSTFGHIIFEERATLMVDDFVQVLMQYYYYIACILKPTYLEE